MTLTARQARRKDLAHQIRHLSHPDGIEVVLLDDDPNADDLRRELGAYGITIRVFGEPVRAVAAAALGTTALFILSCHLDPRDLQAITETVRHQLGVPVVLACDQWNADVVGAAVLAGARPVLTLPYTIEGVVAAIEEVGRRTPSPQTALRVGDLVMDLEAHDVSVAGVHVDLSRSEFEALQILASSVDTTVARTGFAAALWPEKNPASTAITAVTRRLRRKLAQAGLPAALHTVRGIGYRLEAAGCVRIAPAREATRSSS